MGNTFYLSFEPALMEQIQTTLGETGSKIIANFSFFGEEVALILILGFLFWCYDKQMGIRLGTNVLIGVVLNPIIKNVALRRRPYLDHPGIKCIRPVDKHADITDIAAQGYSFPSGHSMNGAITYGTIAKELKKRIVTILAVVLTLLVGISRVVAGVHYPTDVLVGWGTGLAVIFIFSKIYDKFGEENRAKVNLVVFLISCLGIIYCRTTDYYTGLGLMGGFFLAIEFEKRYVNFQETRNPVHCVLRIIGGGLVYLILNTGLKLPFSKEFLDQATMAAFLVRTVRYFIVTFVMIGVYPMAFKLVKGKDNA